VDRLASVDGFKTFLSPSYLITLKETAYQWVDENEKKIIEWSDTVWGYAELGLLEYKTSKYLSDITEKAGFKVDRGVAP